MIKLFFLLYLMNIFIFGQKLFFEILTSDDYVRFYLKDNLYFLISDSGRWAQVLLNKYIFWEKLQILTYLHSLLGIFVFTIMGFCTAKYFKLHDRYHISIVTLLISATPMFAHNLVFTTNITTWVSMLFAYVFFLTLDKQKWFIQIFTFVCFVFAIGNYQTIIQVSFVVIVFRMFVDLLQVKTYHEILYLIVVAVKKALFIVVALVVSNKINDMFISHYHLVKADRYVQFGHIYEREYLSELIKKIYGTLIRFDYFSIQIHVLYTSSILLGVLALFYLLYHKNTTKIFQSIVYILTVILVLVLPIILNIPLLVENWIAVRSHFTIGWVIAGFYILALHAKGITKTIANILAIAIIIISIYYINIFLDAEVRQTYADTLRANLIVERIRMNKNYIQEPLKFKVVGVAKFNVKGMKEQFNQAFTTKASINGIFMHYTDLQFTPMSDEEYNEVQHYLIQQGEKVYAYPGKNSIVVYKNKAVLFFDNDKINYNIAKRKYLSKLPHREADINATFSLYLEKNVLFYEKKSCTKKDIEHDFFLRIYKKGNLNDNAPNQNLDFTFLERGKLDNHACVAAVPIAIDNIEKIYTGQFQRGKKIYWEQYLYTHTQEN